MALARVVTPSQPLTDGDRIGLRVAGGIVGLLGLAIVAAVLFRLSDGDNPAWMMAGLGAGGLFLPALAVAALLESRSPDRSHRWAGLLPIGLLVLMLTILGLGALLDAPGSVSTGSDRGPYTTGQSRVVGVVLLLVAAVLVGICVARRRLRGTPRLPAPAQLVTPDEPNEESGLES